MIQYSHLKYKADFYDCYNKWTSKLIVWQMVITWIWNSVIKNKTFDAYD